MRSKKGTIIRKSEKTLSIEVHTYKLHPKYLKRYRSTRKFLVDNPENKYEVGEVVRFFETRPISKRKCWTVVEPTQSSTKSSK